eukprot:Pgem_evm1s8094
MVKFETGVTNAQKTAIAKIVKESLPTTRKRRSTCAEKTACYADCWVPIVGVACLTCDEINCDRRRSVTFPDPSNVMIGFETG